MMHTAFIVFLVSLLTIPALFLLAGRWRSVRLAASALLLAVFAIGTALAAIAFWRGDTLALDLSGFAPLPVALALDRLSAFFLLLICTVSLPVILFSTSYVERHYAGVRRSLLWALLPLFIGSMVVVVTASTGFAFFFGWELMTLLSAALILVDGDAGQRRHSIFVYLLMMHAGAAAVVAAFLMFLPHTPSLDFASLRSAAALLPSPVRTAIFLLAFVGFGTKAGLVPLHLWLPRAHPIAPSPVSALMSAVMLKTAVYGFVRFSFDLLGPGPSWWGYVVLAAGGVSALLGVLYAISEHDIKRMLAYSSVENIGIIFLGVGASLLFLSQGATSWAALALVSALLHSLNHALFKSALFLGAGAISDATHTVDLLHLGGLLRRMRVTGLALLVACCSIVGLPLCNGFVSEWLIFRSFLAGAGLANVRAAIVLPLLAGILGLVGGIAAACFAQFYGVAFLGRPRSDEAEHAVEVPRAMSMSLALLAIACVALGVAPGFMLRPLGTLVHDLVPGSTLPAEAFTLGRVLPWVAAGAIVLVAALVAVQRAARITRTWACGLPALDRRMQYTSTAFSKPLRRVFAPVYRPERNVQVVPANDRYFPTTISYRSVRTTSYERILYRPAVDAVVAAAHRLRRLQTGNIQVYLLYIFLALVGLLVFVRFA
jgi:hydrogenase-4 component B